MSCELKERFTGGEVTFLPRSCLANSTLSTNNKVFILSHTLAPYVSRLTFHVFMWRRGWVFEVACAETALAPTEGASPLVGSPRGGHIPRDPPCSNPTLRASMLSHTLAPYVSRLTFHVFMWRRGWDSNPRSHCWDACFPSMSIRPLSHLSAPILRGGILTRGLVTGKVSTIVAE